MKKVISVALSIIIIISMSTFTLASDASNSITLSQNTVSMLTSQSAYSQKLFKYAEDVINMIEGTQDIIITKANPLYRVDNDEQFAFLCQLNIGGYAIIDIVTCEIYEYSTKSFNPYTGKSGEKYYCGPLQYLTKKSNKFVDTKSNKEISTSELRERVNQRGNIYPTFSNSKATIYTNLMEKEAALTAVKSTRATQKFLSSELSTSWKNGWCGPTAAYIMFEYMGKVRSNSLAPTKEIEHIGSFVGQGSLTLSSMKKGMNNYLSTYSVGGSVASTSFSMSRIMTEINNDKPITIGGNNIVFDDGTTASGGHVTTCHGYYRNGSGSSAYNALYLNNGWGENYITVTFTGTYAPSYFKDHIYWATV